VVEQRNHNPLVGGSNPSTATNFLFKFVYTWLPSGSWPDKFIFFIHFTGNRILDYLSFGRAVIQKNPESRTLYGVHEGSRIWIKQPCPPKARIWHDLQKFLAWVCRQPILRCTVSPGGGHSLRQEADRLQEFKDKGYNVPSILALDDDLLVLSDAGPQLRSFLDKMDDANGREQILLETVRALANLHANGMVHGRPYTRDMTWDGEQIGFLDLEENPAKVMPMPMAQARDIWVFLGSAARHARDGKYNFSSDLIKSLYREYTRHVGPEIIAELRIFVNFLSPLRRLGQTSFLWPKIGKDARQSVFITQCLHEELKD